MKRPDGAHMTSGEMEERIRELEGKLDSVRRICELAVYSDDDEWSVGRGSLADEILESLK